MDDMVEMRKIPKTFCIRACVYPDHDDSSMMVAHCLELDVIGLGLSVEAALDELFMAVETQLDGCERHGAQSQFWAPDYVWAIYNQARQTRRKIPDEILERVIRNANVRLGISAPNMFDTVLIDSQVPPQCLPV